MVSFPRGLLLDKTLITFQQPLQEMVVAKHSRQAEADSSKEQWAVNVDTSSPVDDFHKRVPAPAKEVDNNNSLV